MTDHDSTSAFVALPTRFGGVLRLLGPPPNEAASAVDPLVKLDEPLGVLQSFVGGLCGPAGELVEPVELLLVLDPSTAPPSEVVPVAALLKTYAALPEIEPQLSNPSGLELVRRTFGAGERLGPLLYCRKRHRLFVARSPHSGEPLRSVAAEEDTAETPAGGIPMDLVLWDTAGEPIAAYSGRSGTCAVGEVASFDQLILDQGGVVRRAAELAKDDAGAYHELATQHTCCTCAERERCFPADDGYAYAADRLLVVHAASSPLIPLPLGAWRLDEAAQMLGGVAPETLCAEASEANSAFDQWRRERADVIRRAGRRRLLEGEPGGRELVEVARLKLGLIADALAQLGAAWQATGRPHLCWNDETVRVAWSQGAPLPATGWGFRTLLRKVGLQPATDVATPYGEMVPYPPAFSSASLLPREAVEAMRYFGGARRANVYVKSSKETKGGVDVHALLEELGVPPALFCAGDVIRATGDGWEAELTPPAEQDPDDGAGLGVRGVVRGDVAKVREGEQFDACECRWYPHFAEAVDLHAVGMLLLQTLLANDERDGERFREAVADEREELLRACRAVPVEQREQQARSWIEGRCESDAPAALWSRRNVLYRREDRAMAALDAVPPALWQAIVSLGLRMMSPIAGFGYCADRTKAAPRGAGGQLLPLLELRGLVALLDDLILGRATPRASLREALRGGD